MYENNMRMMALHSQFKKALFSAEEYARTSLEGERFCYLTDLAKSMEESQRQVEVNQQKALELQQLRDALAAAEREKDAAAKLEAEKRDGEVKSLLEQMDLDRTERERQANALELLQKQMNELLAAQKRSDEESHQRELAKQKRAEEAESANKTLHTEIAVLKQEKGGQDGAFRQLTQSALATQAIPAPDLEKVRTSKRGKEDGKCSVQ